MHAEEVVYSVVKPYPDWIQRGRQTVVKFPLRRGSSLQAPSAGTFALIDPNGDTVTSGNVTITGSIAQYTLSSSVLASTLVVGEGYQEVWTLTLADGTTRTYDWEAAIILRPFFPVVAQTDIEGEYPLIDTLRGSLITDWQGFIDAAWKEIMTRLIAEGAFPYRIKSPSAFRSAHLNLALAKIWRFLASHSPHAGHYLELEKKHQELWNSAWATINFAADNDDDGRPEDPNSRQALGTITHASAAPFRSARHLSAKF
jgi:hypothetical protein